LAKSKNDLRLRELLFHPELLSECLIFKKVASGMDQDPGFRSRSMS
jgi:hypothetical protein